MTVKPDEALARKVTTIPNAGSQDSIDLTVEEALKSPKDVLALGQVIVRELELAGRGTVLERWMAHHLAEVLDEVDKSTGSEKADAEARAVKLILELWLHRRALPKPVDPLGGLRGAIEVLELLAPDANPWRHPRGPSRYDDLLRQTFHALAKIVVYGALLAGEADPYQPSGEPHTALSDEERHFLAMVSQWLPVQQKALKADVHLLPAHFSDSEDEVAEAADTDAPNLPSDPKRQAIFKELLATKTVIQRLLDRWGAQTNPSEVSRVP